MKVRLTFVGAGLWSGSDEFPHEVPVPRIPVAGDLVRMPDTSEWWCVAWVGFDYQGGLALDATVEVVCEKMVER